MSDPSVIPFPTAPPVAVDLPVPPDRSHATRWKHEGLFAKGYVSVPTLFLHVYGQLKPHPLSPAEAMFVVHLMQFKWDERAPFPSHKTLARQMGVSDKQTRRYAASLIEKGYLKRIERTGRTNQFDLSPLFDAAMAAVKLNIKAAAEAAGVDF